MRARLPARPNLFFVIEEESDPPRFSILRLAHYCLDIADLLGTRRVVPLVVPLREGPAERALELGGDAAVYVQFRFLRVELAHLPYRRDCDNTNLVARLNRPSMA